MHSSELLSKQRMKIKAISLFSPLELDKGYIVEKNAGMVDGMYKDDCAKCRSPSRR